MAWVESAIGRFINLDMVTQIYTLTEPGYDDGCGTPSFPTRHQLLVSLDSRLVMDMREAKHMVILANGLRGCPENVDLEVAQSVILYAALKHSNRIITQKELLGIVRGGK